MGRRARHQRRRRDARAPDPGPAGRLHDAARASATSTGRHVAIVGDLTHSRVLRSNLICLARLGARVTVVAPPTLMPSGIAAWAAADGFATSYDLDAVLPAADAVMMLRVQRERMSGGFFPTPREYTVGYGLTRDRLRLLQEPHRHLPPRPDEPRPRDRRRRRRRGPVADPRPGLAPGSRCGCPSSTTCSPATAAPTRPRRPGSQRGTEPPCTKECHEHRDDPAGQGSRPRRSGRRGPAGARTASWSRWARSPPAADAEVLDADGLVALPGLVDLHTHLREPGREDAETIATGAAAAAVGGYTAILAMANTTPVTDTAEAAERIAELGAAHRPGRRAADRGGHQGPGRGGARRARADGPLAGPGARSSPTTATASTTRG